MSRLIVMEETVNHIFKHDASVLENMMQRGYDRKITKEGDVYLSVNPDVPPSPLCYPTTYKVRTLNYSIIK